MAKSSKIGGIYAELFLKDVKFRKGLKAASSALGGFAAKAAKTAAVAGTALTAALAAGSVHAVKAASDMQETLGKSEQIFGASADAMEEWASTSATSFGQSGAEALAAAADVGNLFKAMGMGEDEAAGMSKSMVELAGDLASFNNTSPEDAVQALGAALRGESEPIRRYGVLLDDATLKAKAFEMGLHDGKGALDPSARALAAYNVILDQTKTAQGDFARTSDGLANSQRIITAQLADMAAEIGTSLLPTVTDLVNMVKTVDFAEFGRKLGEGIATGVELLMSGDIWDAFIVGAEIAILKLDKKMGGLNRSVSAHINAGIDFFTGEGGFAEGVAKYNQPVDPEIEALESRLGDILDRNKPKRDLEGPKEPAPLPYGPTAADFLSGSDLERLGFAVGEGFADAEAEQDKTEPERFDFETARSGVNTMQARGLAQGAIQDRRKEDKKLSMMEEMVSILRDAQTNGELVFR